MSTGIKNTEVARPYLSFPNPAPELDDESLDWRCFFNDLTTPSPLIILVLGLVSEVVLSPLSGHLEGPQAHSLFLEPGLWLSTHERLCRGTTYTDPSSRGPRACVSDSEGERRWRRPAEPGPGLPLQTLVQRGERAPPSCKRKQGASGGVAH